MYPGFQVLQIHRNSCVQFSSPTGKVQRSPSWHFTSSFILKLLFNLLTNLIQPPHLRFPLCSRHTELPGVSTSLPSCLSDWILPTLLPIYMHILMSGRQVAPQHQSLASSFAVWESLRCLSSQPPGRVSHSLPGLEQNLIIHSSYNTSFILCTCLSPQQDTELLRTSLCYSFLPLAPSPVLGTSTEAFWFPDIPLTFLSCSQRTGKLDLPKINFLFFESF